MSPLKPLRRRLGHHWLVTGTTQSGKTTLARQLLEDTPRIINLDFDRAYEDMGSPALGFREAAIFLRDHRLAESFHLVMAADDRAHHLGLLDFAWEAWDALETPPALVVVDEAHWWSQLEVGDSRRGKVPSEMRRLYTEGLKRGLAVLTITQFPQDVDTLVRSASDYKVSFRHTGTLTGDMRNAWGERRDELSGLETLTPGDRPQKGNHYLTHPADMQLESWWRREIVNPMT